MYNILSFQQYLCVMCCTYWYEQDFSKMAHWVQVCCVGVYPHL